MPHWPINRIIKIRRWKWQQERLKNYSVFSLTWPASIQIYWNKRKRLHQKRVQLPQDWFETQTWPPFHCFGAQIWPPWRHVKTHTKQRFCTCTFLYISLPSLREYSVKMPNFTFHRRSKQVTAKFSFCCWTWIWLGKFAYIDMTLCTCQFLWNVYSMCQDLCKQCFMCWIKHASYVTCTGTFHKQANYEALS